MTKRLIQIGNSLALVIDKPILELLHIGPKTELELNTDGDKLLISPVRNESKVAAASDVRQSIRSIMAKHHKTFEMLAKNPQ